MPTKRLLLLDCKNLHVLSAADMWVAVAGPLTHVPMVIFWVCMLIAATYAAYGHTHIQLGWPYDLTMKTLGVAVCVGAVIVSGPRQPVPVFCLAKQVPDMTCTALHGSWSLATLR